MPVSPRPAPLPLPSRPAKPAKPPAATITTTTTTARPTRLTHTSAPTHTPTHNPNHTTPAALARPPRLPSHSRLVLALRDTPIIWADTLPHPAATLALLQRQPASPPFRARIAPYHPSSPAVLTYPVRLHLTPSALLLRAPPHAPHPIAGLLPLAGHRLHRVRPGVLALAAVLLEPDPRDFSAVAAALARAAARPPAPALPRFEVRFPLAAGAHVKVYAARDRATGQHVALKLLHRPALEAHLPAWRARLAAQRALLQRVRGHPFVVDMRHAFLAPGLAAFVLEECPGGDLRSLLRVREAPLRLAEAVSVVAQVVLAVACVHEVGGVVGALRPENVLVDADGWIRLAAFSSCSVLDDVFVQEACAFRRRAVEMKKEAKREAKKEARKSRAKDAALVNPPRENPTQATSRRPVLSTDAPRAKRPSASNLEQKGENAGSLARKTPTEAELVRSLPMPPSSTSLKATITESTPEAAEVFSHVPKVAELQPGRRERHADLWSLGLFAHYVLTCTFPSTGDTDSQFEEDSSVSTDAGASEAPSSQDVTISSAIQDDAARDFIGGLLKRDAATRLGCGEGGLAELRKHRWLASVQWQELERRNGPGPLKEVKYNDVDLLDLTEENLRQTFSPPVLPDGLSRRENKRGRLSKLFARDAKDANDSIGGSPDHAAKGAAPVTPAIPQAGKKARQVGGSEEDRFLFGFGFSSTSPGFSSVTDPRPGAGAEGSNVTDGESRRKRRSGNGRRKPLVLGCDIAR